MIQERRFASNINTCICILCLKRVTRKECQLIAQIDFNLTTVTLNIELSPSSERTFLLSVTKHFISNYLIFDSRRKDSILSFKTSFSNYEILI